MDLFEFTGPSIHGNGHYLDFKLIISNDPSRNNAAPSATEAI